MINSTVEYYRNEIDKLVTREERVSILAQNKAVITEFINGKFKHFNNPNPDKLAKNLLTAINNFDIACFQGINDKIHETGRELIDEWKQYK
jgi:hypothetical protein